METSFELINLYNRNRILLAYRRNLYYGESEAKAVRDIINLLINQIYIICTIILK